MDATGKTVLPGLVDAHAHGGMGSNEIMPQQNWMQLSNLAFGVTTIHDPSNHTGTIFEAAERQKTGTLLAPRIFSTGTILYGAKSNSAHVEVDDLDWKATDASLLNSSPHSEGWIYKVEPANWVNEVQFLIMGNPYRLWLKKEFQRLKDFLADTLKTEDAAFEPVLQDGGEVNENILMVLGPEIWEDFQTNFLDVPS